MNGSPGPLVWAASIAGLVLLLGFDYLQSRRPKPLRLRSSVVQSCAYIAVAIGFAAGLYALVGSSAGNGFIAGYAVEKVLSIDNLFVFVILFAALGVPAAFQQKALNLGVSGALVMRGGFIAVGAAAIERFAPTFAIFAAVLGFTAVKVWRRGGIADQPPPDTQRLVRLIRRVVPVSDTYANGALTERAGARRSATMMLVTVVALLGADVVFALDSVPAIYGVVEDPYLVLMANSLALVGMRPLYFLVSGLLVKLHRLHYGLAAILGFVAVKLALHAARELSPAVPEIPEWASLLVVVSILAASAFASAVKPPRLLHTHGTSPAPHGPPMGPANPPSRRRKIMSPTGALSSRPARPLPDEHIEAALHSEAERLQGLLDHLQEELESSTEAGERRHLELLVHEWRYELGEVSAALSRLATGDYGDCDRCDRPIATERLRARPESRLCVQCASRPAPRLRTLISS